MRIKIDIHNMPIYEAACRYGGCRFHMPGHKAAPVMKKFFGRAASLDITELSFSDNLLNAKGAILEAEMLCAKLYGAERVKFGTCGSTVNILSLIHSLRPLGGKLIIQKNSHVSVYSALLLSDIEPVILECSIDEDGIPKHPAPGDVKGAVEQNPDCIGALITSPDYFGFCADLRGIKEALKGRLLLVDAAHGGHLPLIYEGIYLPADAYAVSAHKALLGLTGASFTAFNDEALFEPFMESFRMFHTSSPSYPVLASLDLSREGMQKNGQRLLKELAAACAELKGKLEKLGYACIKNDDPAKLAVKPPRGSGHHLYKKLEERGAFLELSTPSCALALLSVTDGKREAKKLFKVLKEVLPLLKDGCPPRSFAGFKTQRAMPYLEAAKAERERVPLSQAVGRVAAANAGLYPPFYPLVTCGEVLTPQICEALAECGEQAFGVDFHHIFVVK
jgi:lysine decarboxylase